MTITTAVSFGLMTAIVLYFVVAFAVRKRAARISYLRGFKKGKCAMIFVAALPLYCAGYMYEGAKFLDAFFSSLTNIIGLVVLKYDTGGIAAAMDGDVFFRATVYYAFALVAINAVLFTLSLCGQRLWQAARLFRFRVTRREKLLLFGYNDGNISLYRSDGVRCGCIVDKLDKTAQDKLYAAAVTYCSTDNAGAELTRAFADLARNRRVTMVVNFGNEEENISLCRAFVQAMETLPASEREADTFRRIAMYVYGDARYAAVYEHLVARANGCLHLVDAHRMQAMQFIDAHPFTRYMDGRHIDYETSLVREDVQIHACLIGFGNTNRQIFLTSTANNQFLTSDGSGGEVALPVQYHIFDRAHAENDKNLNHSYYRFRNETEGANPADYLPLPSLPAEEHYHLLDINDPEFYRRIRAVVTRSPRDVNFVVIAFGTDLENIDMAIKLAEKKREWGADDLHIFVKVREKSRDVAEEDFVRFGALRDVYTMRALTDDEMTRMSHLRNQMHALEYTRMHDVDFVPTPEAIAAHRAKCERDWYLHRTQRERESNLYGILSLRSKLHMMGLDYRPKGAGEGALTEAQYLSIYAKGDPVRYDTRFAPVDGKKIISYTLDFPPSRRRTLAVHEHLRWNSYMIGVGTVPATIDTILHEEIDGRHTWGKNYAVRRHGNLTTFDGLVTFRRLVAQATGGDEATYDVIKYDYQLLDEAWWLLDSAGYEIFSAAETGAHADYVRRVNSVTYE